MPDGPSTPPPHERWEPDLGAIYADEVSEQKRLGVDHGKWLLELVDAQAYRGRTGVGALLQAWREEGRLPPTPTLRSHMDVAIEEAGAVRNGSSNETLPDGG
jgi:hypothetical protein